ncbi:MAG TPA: hypothetical protein PLW80_09515, partial [Spirochaetales bacterium]|nr:hypothetical protein [Spirochaetales bacterium]
MGADAIASDGALERQAAQRRYRIVALLSARPGVAREDEAVERRAERDGADERLVGGKRFGCSGVRGAEPGRIDEGSALGRQLVVADLVDGSPGAYGDEQ